MGFQMIVKLLKLDEQNSSYSTLKLLAFCSYHIVNPFLVYNYPTYICPCVTLLYVSIQEEGPKVLADTLGKEGF